MIMFGETTATEIAGQVKNVNSPATFLVFINLVMGLIAIGLSGWSKLDKQVTTFMVVCLFTLIISSIMISLFFIFLNPKKLLYTRSEWMEKEKLSDSNSKAVFSSKDLSIENIITPPTQ